MDIRAARPDDAGAIAALHMTYLPPGESDFTQLGAAIVQRFYRNVIERGCGAVFCAVEGDTVAAYVLVTANIRDLFPCALLAGPRDVAAFLAQAITLGVLRALRTKLTSKTLVLRPVPEAVYLIVDPAFRGRKLGALLMERADRWFVEQGLSFYELNAHADNEAVLKVHYGNGHRKINEFVKDGVRLYTLRKELVDSRSVNPSRLGSAQAAPPSSVEQSSTNL